MDNLERILVSILALSLILWSISNFVLAASTNKDSKAKKELADAIVSLEEEPVQTIGGLKIKEGFDASRYRKRIDRFKKELEKRKKELVKEPSIQLPAKTQKLQAVRQQRKKLQSKAPSVSDKVARQVKNRKAARGRKEYFDGNMMPNRADNRTHDKEIKKLRSDLEKFHYETPRDRCYYDTFSIE